MKEQTKEFKGIFVKAKDPESSHIVLEQVYFNAPHKTFKSHIVYDSLPKLSNFRRDNTLVDQS